MTNRLMILSTLLVNVLIACGDPKPVSTGTKAPGLKPITGTTPPTTTTPATGDATKGSTLVTSRCVSCHTGSFGHKLGKSDSTLMAAAAADTANHGSVSSVLADAQNQADIAAYLATQ